MTVKTEPPGSVIPIAAVGSVPPCEEEHPSGESGDIKTEVKHEETEIEMETLEPVAEVKTELKEEKSEETTTTTMPENEPSTIEGVDGGGGTDGAIETEQPPVVETIKAEAEVADMKEVDIKESTVAAETTDESNAVVPAAPVEIKTGKKG